MTKKTETAWKVSASWTPGADASAIMARWAFGEASPMKIMGGRITINAAILLDITDPDQAARAAARVKELRAELDATGTVHRFTAAAGAVPAGAAERLPVQAEEGAGA